MIRSSRAVRVCALALVVAGTPFLAACSDSKKDKPTSTVAGPSGVATKANVCKPVAGTDLVTLADDKVSQASDNIIPAVNLKVAKAPLTDALNAVSKVLNQDTLTGLNRQTSANQKPADVAKAFVAAQKLGDGLSGGSGKIVIGTQDFPESTTLGDIYADVLTKAGYTTSLFVGTRATMEPALESNKIQVIPEYAASLTIFVAKRQGSSAQPSSKIDETVTTLKPLAAKAGFTVLDPATATDENAFAVTKATATKYGLTKMSDIATKCGTTGITFGAGADCPTNAFCLDVIKSTYGITVDFKSLDYDGALTRNALKQGRILIGEVFSSDADLIKAGS